MVLDNTAGSRLLPSDEEFNRSMLRSCWATQSQTSKRNQSHRTLSDMEKFPKKTGRDALGDGGNKTRASATCIHCAHFKEAKSRMHLKCAVLGAALRQNDLKRRRMRLFKPVPQMKI